MKDPSSEPSQKDERVNACCTKYAFEQGWAYSVVHPKSIPSIVAQNAKLLMGFLQPRRGFEAIIPQVVSRLTFLRTATVEELSRGFQSNTHPLQVLPIIYHLIAKGIFVTNINRKIDQFSEIKVASGQNGESNFFIWRAEHDSQSTEGQF